VPLASSGPSWALPRRAFPRLPVSLSMLPLIAFPLLYNTVFLVGTMNYVFGIGLSLWALAAWAALRERAMTLRLAVSTLIVFLLFFCHLFSVGVYAIGVLAGGCRIGNRGQRRGAFTSQRATHLKHCKFFTICAGKGIGLRDGRSPCRCRNGEMKRSSMW